MKRLLILLTMAALLAPLQAEETPAGGELALPWQDFQRLLKLDQDTVSLTWDEFQKLLRQTGVTETPPYQLQNGKVVLGRAEFKRLLDQMRPPADRAGAVFLTKAVYSARVGRRGTTVTGKIRLQATGRVSDNAPVRLQLFPGGMAFQDILIDGRPALIESDGGATYITVTRAGEQEITAVFAADASLEKEPFELSFAVPQTPITQLEVFLPAPNMEVIVTGAAQKDTVAADGGTRVRANLAPTQYIQARWTGAAPARDKGPAKLYAVTHNLLSIDDDALRVTTRLELDILQNTLAAVSIQIPEGYEVLDVEGDGVGEWKKRDGRVVSVPFSYPKRGRVDLTVTTEKILKERSAVVAFDGVQVLGAVRESGFVAVDIKSTAEVSEAERQGATRLDVQELPATFNALTQRPVKLAFKYARPPFRLGLDIRRHEEVAVVSTVVDQANAVTLLLEDGKSVTNLTFSVRNSQKQFLELDLPKDAEVWSAVVEGQKVRPTRNDKGRLLLPLNRSEAVNGGFSTFDVEIVYYQGHKSLGVGGLSDLRFPTPDVLVSQLLWSVYLPTEYDYLHFGGTVEKEKEAQGLSNIRKVITGKRRVINELQESAALFSRMNSDVKEKNQRLDMARQTQAYQSRSEFSASQAVSEDAYVRQVERELNFLGNVGQDGAGATIRVQVPTSGQVYRFSKLLVGEGQPMRLSIFFVHHGIFVLLGLGIFAGLCALAWRQRGRVIAAADAVKAFVDAHERALGWLKTPAGLAATALVLMVVLALMSRFLGAVGFLIFFVAVGRWAWTEYLSRRSA